jgi:hypothetical protein
LPKTPDVVAFVDNVEFIVNEAEDMSSWLILVRMFNTLPQEMACWTFFDKALEDCFYMWQVVRKFRSRVENPAGATSLLDFCRTRADGPFEGVILNRFNKIRAEKIGKVTQTLGNINKDETIENLDAIRKLLGSASNTKIAEVQNRPQVN